MFTDKFLSVSTSVISGAMKNVGFFFMESALTEEFMEKILADVENYSFSVNRNWVGGVYANRQYYLTHMLACSESFTNLVTSEKVLAICDDILGSSYRLKALRYYETYGKHKMQWHTDNKTDRGFAHIPGLIFVAYLVDVNDGEFQYVRGSHRSSGETAYSDYTDNYIDTNHAKDIVSFKASAGAVVIYDTYGIHRAKPVTKSNFVRKSLFFQVDSKIDSAEPILLNPAFLHAIDNRTMAYLGFGLPSEYQIYPQTSINSLPIGKVNFLSVISWVYYRSLRFLYDSMPLKIKSFIHEAYNGRKKSPTGDAQL